MNTLIDFLLQFGDLFLIGNAIILLTFFLSLLFKKRSTLIVAVAIVVVGTIFIVYQSKYTTFQELVSNQINEENTVRDISITINDLSSDIPERKASVTIGDEEITERILEDFSEVELREDQEARPIDRKYRISIRTTNEIEENVLKTDSFTLSVNDNYIDDYEIISETDHLKTIESLVESEEAD
ncbi:hypothetical protein J2Z83_002358 [Virgibacillus natechei]|uniref:Uncharacterized protein n=1 Tax=Virgibacillus natechei TaxID=1216297 RepID=A0ABS4IH12_9BACI|nr:hypothetical protein [Virgibacillus natechei]MBP1970240.1 hypothetical protein [Virgibacillus natechei]UZD12813.1 hypothetical protein OLD84_18315 [Virgibacillus natechei]